MWSDETMVCGNRWQAALLMLALATFSSVSAAQDASSLGRPSADMQSTSNASTQQTASTPIYPATISIVGDTPPAEGAPVYEQAGQQSTYDDSRQAVVLPNGIAMPLNEMAPGYSASNVQRLEGVNANNVGQATSTEQQRLSTTSALDAQAYRTTQNTAVRSGAYGVPTQILNQSVQAVPEPHSPGTLGLTPSLYFGGTAPAVTVRVSLTGGVGPAQVSFRTTGGSAPGSWYTPTSGTLVWQRGEYGVRTIRVPVNVAAIDAAHASGEVTFQLYGASGAALAGAASGRIVLQPRLVGVKTPPCGTGGVPCSGLGSVVPGTTATSGQQPPQASGRGPQGDDCLPGGYQAAAARAYGVSAAKCR